MPNLLNPIRPFSCNLSIKSGGSTFRGAGSGLLHKHTGEIQVRHRYESVSKTFQLDFMSALALTGTPEPEFTLGPAINPFPSTRKFSFTRRVRFSDDAEFVCDCDYVRNSEDILHGDFRVEGVTPRAPDIIGIEPTIETWTPMSETGDLRGHFEMIWQRRNGRRIIGSVTTEYKLHSAKRWKAVKATQFRYITIQHSVKELEYFQQEQISLFATLPGHVDKIRNLPPLASRR